MKFYFQCLKILTLFLIAYSVFIHIELAGAQFVPLPPPSPSDNTAQETPQTPNDNKAPIIKILTTTLKPGKNVFWARITDDTGVKIAVIKYVHQGNLRTADFVKDLNDAYKALIDVEPPSKVIVIDAEDPNGNIATAIKEYNIQPASNILQQLEDFFSGIFGNKH